MAECLLINEPSSPDLSMKTIFSRESATSDEYLTPRASVQSSESSSDSTSTLTDDSDDETTVHRSSIKQVHFNLLASKIETYNKPESDQTESVTSSPLININGYTKKHNIKNLSRSNSESSDTDIDQLNETKATTLVSMQQDVQQMITDLDKMNTSKPSLTSVSQFSSHENQQRNSQLIRIEQILNPPNLLTFNAKESPYPYTDIIAPRRQMNLFHLGQSTPRECFYKQHKPFRHRKFRYRSQRCLLKIRHDIKKLKHDLYGRQPITSHRELPSFDIQNYRIRLEKSLREVRKQIAEYDRIHASTKNHRQSISQIIAKMKAIDPTTQAQIEDYRTKLRPIEFIKNERKYELISTPFIYRRVRKSINMIKKDDNNNNQMIDTRFDPTTFVDLIKESEAYFGSRKPFWDQPAHRRLSVVLDLGQTSNELIETPKLEIWARISMVLKSKLNDLKNAESKKIENYHSEDLFNETNNDEYSDCFSSLPQQQSQLLLLENTKQLTNSFNDIDIVYF